MKNGPNDTEMQLEVHIVNYCSFTNQYSEIAGMPLEVKSTKSTADGLFL